MFYFVIITMLVLFTIVETLHYYGIVVGMLVCFKWFVNILSCLGCLFIARYLYFAVTNIIEINTALWCLSLFICLACFVLSTIVPSINKYTLKEGSVEIHNIKNNSFLVGCLTFFTIAMFGFTAFLYLYGMTTFDDEFRNTEEYIVSQDTEPEDLILIKSLPGPVAHTVFTYADVKMLQQKSEVNTDVIDHKLLLIGQYEELLAMLYLTFMFGSYVLVNLSVLVLSKPKESKTLVSSGGENG